MFFSMTSCSEKFNIAAPYKDVTVIYGFLEQSDTAHYIRIQKAFLDANKSAITMAQTADSSFYSSINVVIKRLDFTSTLIDTIHLNRVDLNLEGYPKTAGAFFNAPNYAYKFKNILDPNYIYRLVVTNYATGNVDSAETPIISEDPNIFAVTMLDDTNAYTNRIDFSEIVGNRKLEFGGAYNPSSNYNYNGYTTPVGVVEMLFRYNWLDSNGVTGQKNSKYYDYDFGFSTLSSGAFDYKILNVNLYNGLVTGMSCAPSGTFRIFSKPQLFVYLGTNDYATYYQVGLSQGTGLTGDEIEPVYTNIKGANVFGLFTSRALRSGYLTTTTSTFDSLRASSIVNPCTQMYWKNF